MTYFNFLKKVHSYLKTVRILKNHVSFDMLFSNTWLITKNKYTGIEIIDGGATDDNKRLLSFVCPLNEKNVNVVEEIIDDIIKVNIEREEKDKLFRLKVQELKNIFEKQKLEDLKGLKFDVDELNVLINYNDDGSENREGTGIGVVTVEEGEEKVEKRD
jgi:hypothetical protein